MLKKILSLIKESLGIISSIITVLVFFWGQSKYAFVLALFTVSWCGISILIPVIQIFRTKRVAKRFSIENNKSKRELNIRFHKFFHMLRDCTAGIDINNTTNRVELKQSCGMLCASICEIMEQICFGIMDNNVISTCVKVVNAKSTAETDGYDNWMIETLGRSPSTMPERMGTDSDKVSLGENTDFLAIVLGKDKYMAFKDMTNIYDDFRRIYKIEYKNSRGESYIDYYKSCIIIPIEIDGERASQEIKTEIKDLKNNKLLLGFLCIDSMKVFRTDEEILMFETALEAAKALGDSLYLFMEKVLICQIRRKETVK